jgi:hypothetical protein
VYCLNKRNALAASLGISVRKTYGRAFSTFDLPGEIAMIVKADLDNELLFREERPQFFLPMLFFDKSIWTTFCE